MDLYVHQKCERKLVTAHFRLDFELIIIISAKIQSIRLNIE